MKETYENLNYQIKLFIQQLLFSFLHAKCLYVLRIEKGRQSLGLQRVKSTLRKIKSTTKKYQILTFSQYIEARVGKVPTLSLKLVASKSLETLGRQLCEKLFTLTDEVSVRDSGLGKPSHI